MVRLWAAICGVVILFAYSSSTFAKQGTMNFHSHAAGIAAKGGNSYVGALTMARHRHNAAGVLTIASRHPDVTLSKDLTIVGNASMYNPLRPGYDSGGLLMASGELYDPSTWTAAIQTDLRETFGGIRYGSDYRPTYALVEIDDKRAIIRINDVGPLTPGRVIDFNEQTMRYFDPSLQRGILNGVRITLLSGDWIPGPVSGEPSHLLIASAVTQTDHDVRTH